MALAIDSHQYTVRQTMSCCGVALHSGRTVNLTIRPAHPDTGICFLRTDRTPHRRIQAHMNNVVDTRLATTIGHNGDTVATTEHLMAALRGFGIDNALIEIDGGEVPIMDGSAAPFLSLLKQAGKERQNCRRQVLKITHPVHYADGERTLTISPYDGFKLTGEIDFADELIQTQRFSITLRSDNFEKEIARARTFGYVEQVEELWANGLALGGSLENVIAIHWNRKSVLNEDGLRYKDEFIRHKILDLVGDMALLGCPILGHIQTFKAGHAQHFGLLQAVSAKPECWQVIELGHGAETGRRRHRRPQNSTFGERPAPFLTPAFASSFPG